MGHYKADTEYIKENMKTYYNDEARLRDSKSVRVDWKVQIRSDFLELIQHENKKTLLELGAGTGYDSRFFIDNGMSVVAVDLSPEMVKCCQNKLVEAYELDYYYLSSLKRKFDCIYALNTLLHVPKTDLVCVLAEIDSVLNEDGLFYMGQYGGNDTEENLVNTEVSCSPRYFTFHSKSYLMETLSRYFEILDYQIININNRDAEYVFHSITMHKKSFMKELHD